MTGYGYRLRGHEQGNGAMTERDDDDDILH